jgi:hypothetical protein
LKQPDDYRQPDAPFRDDETAGGSLDQQGPLFRRQTVERSFETQSGYLVLIKQLGSRYALSFKRQIGTPPTTSIFLTADEGKRLADMFGSNSRPQSEDCISDGLKESIDSLRSLRNRSKSPFTILTVLFIITIILCAAVTIFVYQTQITQTISQ